MRIRIRCPQCGHAQLTNVLGEAPSSDQDTTCPTCRHPFKFRIPTTTGKKPGSFDDVFKELFGGFRGK